MRGLLIRFVLPWLIVMSGFAFPALAAADHAGEPVVGDPVVREASFAAGGLVILNANVGDVRVAPSEEDGKLSLVITSHKADDAAAAPGWIREFAVNGSQAKIVLLMPNHGNHDYEVVLYVPARSDLKLHLEVGDLSIRGVTGNTDAELGVGDLKMRVGDAHQYRSVDLSVHIGDVDAKAFQLAPSGFLGKSVEKQFATGSYRLKLHTGIGDVSCLTAANP